MAFSKIKKIKKLNRKEKCYDIQVENSHCYYSNDILSHNSAAIVDSIVYALFGKTTKSKLKADRVVNKINKKDCFVELSFNIRSDEYIVRRYREHSEFKNDLIVDKNGITLSSSDEKRGTQKLIESIIKISFKSFVLSIVLSQEKVANFAEVEKLERKQIIENLLMYDFISKYHKATKRILRKIKPEIEKLNSQHSDKKEIINTLTHNLLNYIEKLEKDSENRKAKMKILKEKIKKLKNLNLPLETKNRAIIVKKEEEFSKAAESLDDIENSLYDYKEKIKKIKEEIKNKNIEIERYYDSPETCPTCGGSIKDKEFQIFISEKKDFVRKKEEELNEITLLHRELEKKYSRKEKRMLKKLEDINEIKGTINEELSDEDIKNLEDKIKDSESEIKFLQQLEKEEIEEIPFVAETQKKIDSVRSEAKSIRRKIRKLENELDLYNWWKDALSNSPESIKSFCINHILRSLNEYINYYISFFGYDMSYRLDEDLNDIITKDGYDSTFAELSRGEKRSVEISLMFALYEITRLKIPDDINLIVLDELLSNFLDEIRIGGALAILQELESRKFDIFVIEHKEAIKEALMCNTINVIKDKRGHPTLETEN